MYTCDHCGDEIDHQFWCSDCEGSFCVHHRLPADHACSGGPAAETGPAVAGPSPSGRGPSRSASSPLATVAKIGLLVAVVAIAVLAVSSGMVSLAPLFNIDPGTSDNGGIGGTEPPASDATPTGDDLDTTLVEALIHEKVNEVREAHDLDTLDYDTDLANVSRAHSQHMSEENFFGHENPEGEGPKDRVDNDDSVSCDAVGENLAQAYWQLEFRSYDDEIRSLESEDEVAQWFVDAWMNSTGHRENLLEPDWERQGIGVHLDDESRVFATQKFCASTGFFPWQTVTVGHDAPWSPARTPAAV